MVGEGGFFRSPRSSGTPFRRAVPTFHVRTCLAIVVAGAAAVAQPVSSQPAVPDDWPMWGGGPTRNMVSEQPGLLPAEWDVTTRRNIRWVADLGTQTFSNPAVSGGKVFIGTNNGQPRDSRVAGDKGVLMCFAAADGRFLWQAVHDKLEAGNAQDWADIGICSSPCVVGDRVYYVSNRGELICADTEGFHDGENDGPLTDERFHGPADADLVWVLDMRATLGITPLFASASAPLVVGDLVFVVTGQGVDDDTGEVKRPEAPSFLAVDRRTGRPAWSDHSPGPAIVAGQWSSPAWGLVDGEPQVVFPGGDGWLYAFRPATGEPLWRFNCRSHEKPAAGDQEVEKNYLVATPVIHDDTVYIAVGQDPESGDGEGCLWAVDAHRRGDVTAAAARWRIEGEEFGRSTSTVAIRDGLLYAAELSGYLNCIEAATGARLRREDLKSKVWASPFVADDKVYIANEDGALFVFRHGRELKKLAENEFPQSVRATMVSAGGVLYIADRSHLYAISGR